MENFTDERELQPPDDESDKDEPEPIPPRAVSPPSLEDSFQRNSVLPVSTNNSSSEPP